MSVSFVAESRLPTSYGEFIVHGFEEISTGKEHLALTMGDVSGDEPVLARIHSECLTGDALFSIRCDCGAQLQAALERIAAEGRGVLLYLRQEGRGIGLLNKIRAYNLQDNGMDTVQANEELGFEPDMRNYDVCKAMLSYLGISSLKLMTNNPCKVESLTNSGIHIAERIPHQQGQNPRNERYLATKVWKMGHM